MSEQLPVWLTTIAEDLSTRCGALAGTVLHATQPIPQPLGFGEVQAGRIPSFTSHFYFGHESDPFIVGALTQRLAQAMADDAFDRVNTYTDGRRRDKLIWRAPPEWHSAHDLANVLPYTKLYLRGSFIDD